MFEFRFLRLISSPSVSHPLSKAEGIMLRLQAACNESANAGRPFLALCSLIDITLSGRLTVSEFMHTAKMMGCPLTREDVDCIRDLVPRATFGRDMELKEDTIDYKELQSAMQLFQPRYTQSSGASYDFESTFNPFRTTAVPAAANTGRNSFDFSRQFSRAITTPLGLTLTENTNRSDTFQPLAATLRASRTQNLPPNNQTVGMIKSQNVLAYDKILRLVAERINLAIDELNYNQRGASSNINLRYEFEFYDKQRTGLISMQHFQRIMSDLNLQLSGAEIQAVQSAFARQNDSRMDYESFFEIYLPRYASGNTSSSAPSPSLNLLNTTLSRQSSLNSNNNNNRPVDAGNSLSYSHPRVIERWSVLCNEGNDPRSYFATYDFDRSGMVDVHKFREVIERLQLLQTEYQLHKALEDFKSIHNPNLIMYEDFCHAIEMLVDRQPRFEQTQYGPRRSSISRDNQPIVDDQQRWKDAYENLNRFRSSQGFDRGSFDRTTTSNRNDRQYPIDLDDDSSAWNRTTDNLGPPKLTDSFSASSRSPFRYRSSSGHGDDISNPLGSTSKLRSSSSAVALPRSSPSKVGAKIWGSHTSLERKGQAPRVDESCWCCAVCLYVENPNNSNVCLICNSPNYSVMKVTVASLSCHFLSIQFFFVGFPIERAVHVMHFLEWTVCGGMRDVWRATIFTHETLVV
jgi:Ca2+-binding EF-hand superfamily protein